MMSKIYYRLLSYDTLESILLKHSRYSVQHCSIKYSKSDRRSILTRCLATTSFACSSDDQNIVKSPFPHVSVPNVSFPKFIWDDNATLRGKNIALVGNYNYVTIYVLLHILMKNTIQLTRILGLHFINF